MKKGIVCFRDILFWFSILLISVLFLVILFFILKGDFCFYCDSNCAFSNWVLHVLSILHPFRAIFNALLILLPIVIALETFHKNVNAQECQSLLELRKELGNESNMKVHMELKKDYDEIVKNGALKNYENLEDENSIIEVVGNENLKDGSVVTIKVTGINGETKEYKIKVLKKADEKNKKSNINIVLVILLIISVIGNLVLGFFLVSKNKKDTNEVSNNVNNIEEGNE